MFYCKNINNPNKIWQVFSLFSKTITAYWSYDGLRCTRMLCIVIYFWFLFSIRKSKINLRHNHAYRFKTIKFYKWTLFILLPVLSIVFLKVSVKWRMGSTRVITLFSLQIKKDQISKLVVLPLYPQFSISTSGSSLRLLEEIFRWLYMHANRSF